MWHELSNPSPFGSNAVCYVVILFTKEYYQMLSKQDSFHRLSRQRKASFRHGHVMPGAEAERVQVSKFPTRAFRLTWALLV